MLSKKILTYNTNMTCTTNSDNFNSLTTFDSLQFLIPNNCPIKKVGYTDQIEFILRCPAGSTYFSGIKTVVHIFPGLKFSVPCFRNCPIVSEHIQCDETNKHLKLSSKILP